MENIDLIGFVTLGFLGGFGHCLGMCHPFVLYISGRFVGDKRGYRAMYLPHLKYNIGRTITYGILGALAGIIGNMATLAGKTAGIQKASAILAGAFLIIYAIFAFSGYNLLNKLEKLAKADKVTGFIKKIQPKTPFTSGLLLGLLPCGIVYGALIAASASANPFKGAASLVLFGLGTSVAMMTAAFFGNFIMRKKGLFNVLSLFLLIGMGVLFIWQGIRF